MKKSTLPTEQVVKEYLTGCSLHEIAQKYKTYPNKILRLLRKLGIKIRDKSSAQEQAYTRGRKEAPFKGKKRTEEDRLKISESMDDYYKDLDTAGFNKIVARAKKNWKKIPKDKRAEMQKRSAESNRKAAKFGSAVEHFVKSFLEENNYLVEFHKKNILSTNLEVDIFLPKESVAIEIDGPSHSRPIWSEEALQRQMKYDLEKNGIITSLGLVLIRVKYDQSKLTLSAKNRIKNGILSLLENFRKEFPAKNDRFVEITI